MDEIKKPAPARELMRASWDVIKLVARTGPGLIAAIVVFAIVMGILPVAEGAVRGSLINHLIEATGSGVWTYAIGLLLAGVIGAAYLAGVLGRLDNYFTSLLWDRTREVIEMETIRAKTSISLEQHEDPQLSNLIQRVTERGGNAAQFTTDMVTLLASSITVVAAAVALASAYWWVCLIVLIGLLPSLIFQGKFSREVWQFHNGTAERRREFWQIRNYFWDAKPITEVRLFGLGRYLTEQARNIYRRLTLEEADLHRRQFFKGLILIALTQSAIAFALGFFVYEVLHGRLQVGTLTFLFGIVVTLSGGLSRIFSLFGNQYERALFIADLMTLLNMKPTLQYPADGSKLAKGVTPTIAFEDVSFTYPGAEKPALEHVSFTLRPGEKLALIGVNGAGKTTLVKLLCRLYDPTEGRITVDGVDLRVMDIDSYYRAFGILFQDYNRYRMPVRESIAVGDITSPVDDARVKAAAVSSESDRFIEEFGKGYDQLLGKGFTGGAELSGGQWQKLAIARVFYRDPRIWVLDEPTAAVDAEAEARIFDRIEKMPDDRSAIIISHRFSTVRNADRILVIKDGTIGEQGTHEELMANPKDYARLFSLQAGRYMGKPEDSR